MSERNLQFAVKEFCDLHKISMMHFANERKCSLSYGKQLKRMGVRAGVSDCFFPRGNDTFKGLWLELKVKPNKPTVAQLDFITEMISYGYAGHVAYTIDEAMAIIRVFYSI